jgi:hypothetical protein
MHAKQAIDFLVTQAAQQAALEGVPLSDLEKRMMYFTEGTDRVEDPVQLNAEFEADYDTTEYETKISKLLKHAHQRLTKEDSKLTLQWNEAVSCLERGDYYILILLQDTKTFFRRYFLTTLTILAVLATILLAWYRNDHR